MANIAYDIRVMLTVVALWCYYLSWAIRNRSGHRHSETSTATFQSHEDAEDVYLTEPIPGPGLYAGYVVNLAENRSTFSDARNYDDLIVLSVPL